MDEQLVLKNKLKEIRTEKGLSQSALAEMVGVSRNTISSIETGQFSPTAKLALIICIALDKKFEDVFYLLSHCKRRKSAWLSSTNSLDSQECNPKKTEKLRSNVRKDSANTGRSRRHQSEWVQAYYRIACAARCHP